MPRPSFGCATCRLRRIKCDEREGGCAKCESYGVQCPGYPERFDVLLRLQTTRADTSEHGSTFVSSSRLGESSGDARPQANAERMVLRNLPIHPQLALDSDSTALAVYLKTNCVDGQPTCSLEQIQTQGNGCLFAAIKVLSNIDIIRKWSVSNAPDLISKSYQDAIQLLNVALASPFESREDGTLLATLIMSSIEMKAAPSMSSTYWEAHTKGAAALLQIRGADQVTTQIGSALFFQVSSQLMMSCILGGYPLPPEMVALREVVQPYLNDDDHPVWRHYVAMIRFTEFIATTGYSTTDREQTNTIITNAHSIYRDITSIFHQTDPIWNYLKTPSPRFPNILDYEHTYHTVLSTQLWNSCRIAIILLCTIVLSIDSTLTANLTLDAETRHFLNNAADILNTSALNTIASVPQSLALMILKDRANLNLHSPPTNESDKCSKGHTSHAPVFREIATSTLGLPYMHGCLVQWSVYFGARSEFVRPGVRRCLWEILEEGGRGLGVRLWRDLAEELRSTLQRVGDG